MGAKMIDEVDFSLIPIWIRVAKMPLGLMMRAVGEMIGGMVGKVIEVEVDEDGTTVGEFMRIKI
jgi:hypothetical protein